MAPQYGYASNVCTTQACQVLAGEIIANIAPPSLNIDPCVDFEKFVCHGIPAHHQIAEGQNSFSLLGQAETNNDEIVIQILEGTYTYTNDGSWLSANFTEDDWKADQSNFHMMKTVYETCLDTEAIEAAGIEPLKETIETVISLFPPSRGKNSTAGDFGKVIAWFEKTGIPSVLSTTLLQDDFVSGQYLTEILPPDTLSMPTSSYGDNATMSKYLQVIMKVLPLVYPTVLSPIEVRSMASSIIQVEQGLAQLIEFAGPNQPDPELPYFRSSPLYLQEIIPRINIPFILSSLSPDGKYTDVLGVNPDFPKNLAQGLAGISNDALGAFFAWRAFTGLSSLVKSPLTQPWVDFLDPEGKGAMNTQTRSQVCLQVVNFAHQAGSATYTNLGWISSRFYLEKVYTLEKRELVVQLVEQVTKSFRHRIDDKEWLTENVKVLVKEKLDDIDRVIGWPDIAPEVVDPLSLADFYRELRVSDSYYDNTLSGIQDSVRRSWARLHDPASGNVWFDTIPITNNAYYTGEYNAIEIPAGIQNSIFFSTDLPGYAQYGFFGTVLGHELTHGFDTNGRLRDPAGKHTNWWDEQSNEQFVKRSECFAEQYDQYTVVFPVGSNQTVHVNGNQTITENIADCGGINISYEAWKSSAQSKTDQGLPGLEKFTNDQLFYMMWGQTWCSIDTDASLSGVLNDVHAPGRARILGPMANSKGFLEAYNCPNKEPICELW